MNQKINSAVLNKIFHGSSIQYGLKEFDNIKPVEALDIFEKEYNKDNSGDYVYRKDKDWQLIFDGQGKKILEHDLDEIAEEYLKFTKNI